MKTVTESPIATATAKPWQESRWWTNLWHRLSIEWWGNLPAERQRAISANYASVYDKNWSRHLIGIYCRWHYPDPNYLQQFKPPNGKAEFETFQDFFTREFIERPIARDEWAWPCEGVLCHSGRVNDIPRSNVKGDIRSVADIFGVKNEDIPEDYHFANVFLHNKNYHRIHSPIRGRVTRIQHIPDELVVLRPWIYKYNPSVPAFRNERINVDIEDEYGRTWFMSIVGGPAVGSIELKTGLKVGSEVKQLDEIAVFYLGSTCCIASPVKTVAYPDFAEIELGMAY